MPLNLTKNRARSSVTLNKEKYESNFRYQIVEYHLYKNDSIYKEDWEESKEVLEEFKDEVDAITACRNYALDAEGKIVSSCPFGYDLEDEEGKFSIYIRGYFDV